MYRNRIKFFSDDDTRRASNFKPRGSFNFFSKQTNRFLRPLAQTSASGENVFDRGFEHLKIRRGSLGRIPSRQSDLLAKDSTIARMIFSFSLARASIKSFSRRFLRSRKRDRRAAERRRIRACDRNAIRRRGSALRSRRALLAEEKIFV